MQHGNGHKVIVGNWKMNGRTADAAEIRALIDASARIEGTPLAVCPPATLIADFARLAAGSRLSIGAQDCSPEPAGAFTGDISAPMLKDAGAALVILGHSERRALHGEGDDLIARKVVAARAAGLTTIVCLGETAKERDAGETLAIVARQLAHSLPQQAAVDGLIIAYEPVWAIGTGRTPTLGEIAEVHAALRAGLIKRFGTGGRGVPILYGGSVKGENALAILKTSEVGGALVGGASLRAKDFLPIVLAATHA